MGTTDQELAFFQSYCSASTRILKPKALVPLRMIPWDDDFDHTAAQVLFHTNKLVLTWIKGEPMPPTLVDDIVKLVPAL